MENKKIEFRFKRSILQEEINRETKCYPFQCFEKWNIKEIRIKCLDTIKGIPIYEYETDDIEECVEDLLEQNDELGGQLLSLYVSNAADKTTAMRALEFAISHRKRWAVKTMIGNRELSKMAAGRLLKNSQIELYSAIPSLRYFLKELLTNLINKTGYFEYDWYCAVRAVDIIIAAKDIFFLPPIEEIIRLHETGMIGPRFRNPAYQKDLNLALLKATKRLLLAARVEQEQYVNQKDR